MNSSSLSGFSNEPSSIKESVIKEESLLNTPKNPSKEKLISSSKSLSKSIELPKNTEGEFPKPKRTVILESSDTNLFEIEDLDQVDTSLASTLSNAKKTSQLLNEEKKLETPEVSQKTLLISSHQMEKKDPKLGKIFTTTIQNNQDLLVKKEVENRLNEIRNQPGYLTIKENELHITADQKLAKTTFEDVKNHLNQLEGKIDALLLNKLKNRLQDEKIKMSTTSMPTSSITQLLENHKQAHGLSSTLQLLDLISAQKMEVNKRYTTVDPWPKEKATLFLHVIPNLGPVAGSPMPIARIANEAEGTSSVILNMMEPSLEASYRINNKEVSNAELLITDKGLIEKAIENLSPEEQEKILNHKNNLDNYYRNKVVFSHSFRSSKGTTRTFLITQPTSRYVTNQFLAITTTDRKDVLGIADQHSTAERFVNKSLKDSTEPLKNQRRNSIATFASEPLNQETISAILNEVETTLNPNSVNPNDADIEGIANILSELPPNSLIGQNAFDASTDPFYQHLQIFIDAPCDLIPCFNAPVELKYETRFIDKKGKEQHFQCARIRPESFHGTIYKFSTKENTEETIQCLRNIQNDFQQEENNGSSLNLIGRKIDGGYEYYFVLRKSISTHPQLQKAALSVGTTRPGWAEMIGIRIGKNEDFFKQIPDENYRDLLSMFGVERKECVTFEDVVKKQLRQMGDVNFNLLETNLRSLRSDAETSQMYHCIKLNGSKDKNDILRLISSSPDDMQPNICVTSGEIEAEYLNFNSLSEKIAHQMLIRKGEDKHYGVIAVDENVLTSLPEYRYVQSQLESSKKEFLSQPNIDDRSFKSFLLNKYQDNPSQLLIKWR